MEEEIKEDSTEENIEHPEIGLEPWWKGPVKYILAAFLVLIIVLWYIPLQAVKMDPRPSYIPKIEEVFDGGGVIIENESRNIVSKKDFLGFVKPNDPVIKQTADLIVSKAGCGSSKICQAKVIFYFVRDNFDYVSDPNSYEYVKSAKESLISGNGDCDDASVLLANLLEAIGIKTRFVFITEHVYIQAELPEALRRYKAEDDWVNLDATCDSCGFGEIPYYNTEKRKSYIG